MERIHEDGLARRPLRVVRARAQQRRLGGPDVAGGVDDAAGFGEPEPEVRQRLGVLRGEEMEKPRPGSRGTTRLLWVATGPDTSPKNCSYATAASSSSAAGR